MSFANRLDAGRQLGVVLRAHPIPDPIVVGISRGGVPVAAEVAHVLGVPLEICVVRKLFSPGTPAFAIGAIAEHDAVYVDDSEVKTLRLSPVDVSHAVLLERAEVARLGELLRDGPPLSLAGRDVILVDDAVTAIDALLAGARSMRAQGCATITLAVPVANARLLDLLRPDFDRVVALVSEEHLVAAGSRYCDFWPVSEHEVVASLTAARREESGQAAKRAS